MAHAVVLAALTTIVLRTIGPARRYSFDVLLCIGFVSSVVLIYAFLDTRYVLGMPRVRRRLLISVCSVVMTTIPVVAVIAAVFMLFVIR